MLSKIIYKALIVFALAFIAQVGYSQNYVSSEAAQTILEQEINQLRASIKSGTTKTVSNVSSVLVSTKSTKGQIEMTKYVLKRVVKDGDSVSEAMEHCYREATHHPNLKKKAKDIAALDVIRDLLS